MKIVITGGAGFLGLHLAKYFVKKRHKVILIDIADFAKSEYPKNNIAFIKTDIRKVQPALPAGRSIELLLKRVDIVIHAAAALPLWKSTEIYDINVNGTKNILEASLKNKVKRFIYISSTAVYGVPKIHPLYENSQLVGVGPYGSSKIKAEKLCEKFRKKGLTISIIRPKTFVGIYRLGVFEILFDWIKDGKRIPVIGNGNNRYQLLDVDDLVEAIYRISVFRDKKKINNVFNIGAYKYQTVKKDLNEVFHYARSGSKVMPTPAMPIKIALHIFEILKLSPLYQWVYDTADKDSYVAIDRLINTLKWKPRYSNAQALIKSYQWYLDNYKDIKAGPQGVTHRTGWKQGILGFFKRFL